MTKVKLINIIRIKRHRYFENRPDVNKQLQHKTILLMINAALHKGNETLLLMDNNDFSIDIVSQDSNEEVYFNDRMKYKLAYANSKFTAFHNHPDGGSFSIADLLTILDNYSVQLLILCDNSCQNIYGLLKSDIVDGITSLKMSNYTKKYAIKNNLNIHSDALPLIQLFVSKGLLYVVNKNY
jgi:hypothetical protein